MKPTMSKVGIFPVLKVNIGPDSAARGIFGDAECVSATKGCATARRRQHRQPQPLTISQACLGSSDSFLSCKTWAPLHYKISLVIEDQAGRAVRRPPNTAAAAKALQARQLGYRSLSRASQLADWLANGTHAVRCSTAGVKMQAESGGLHLTCTGFSAEASVAPVSPAVDVKSSSDPAGQWPPGDCSAITWPEQSALGARRVRLIAGSDSGPPLQRTRQLASRPVALVPDLLHLHLTALFAGLRVLNNPIVVEEASSAITESISQCQLQASSSQLRKDRLSMAKPKPKCRARSNLTFFMHARPSSRRTLMPSRSRFAACSQAKAANDIA